MLLHCKNIWVISTCFCLSELLTSITRDDCNSDNHKWVETTQTFLQCSSVAESAALLQVLLPRVLQALLAALGDLCVLKSASLMFGAKAGKYAVSCVGMVKKMVIYLPVVISSGSSTNVAYVNES